MAQSYFYQTESDVLFVNEDTQTVGVNNNNAQYDLDVKDTIHTSNLISNGLIHSSNILNTGQIESSTALINHIEGSNLTTSNILNTGQIESSTALINHIEGSNLTASNITTANNLNINGNIFYDGYNMYDPYPDEPITADWWFANNPGVIHMSWIRDEANIFQDIMGVLGTLVDAGDFLNEMYQWYKIWSGNNTKVDWDEIGNRPIASKGDDIGFDGNIYVGHNYKLKTCSSSKFMTNELTGILDFNFIVDNAPVPVSGDTILDFETREMTLSNIKLQNTYEESILDEIVSKTRTTTYTSSGITTGGSNFSIDCFNFESNAIHSTSNILINSSSNVIINDIILKKGQYGDTTLISTNVDASSFRDIDNFGTCLNFLSFESSWKFADRYATGSYSTNANDWTNTYLYVKPKTLEFKTQERSIGGIGQPLITQFSVNSNGTLYCRSNIQMNSPAVIRSVQTTIDDYPREGLLKIEPTVMQYIQRVKMMGVDYDYVNLAADSNGLFLRQRCSVFGKGETFVKDTFLGGTISSFPRLDIGMENGLVYGYGLNQDYMAGNYDVFKVSYKGELSTLNHNNYTMRQIVNSNAELVAPLKIGRLAIDTDGTLTLGKLKIGPSGAMYMKFDNQNYEMIIGTVKEFKADTANQPYLKSAFKF